MQDLLLGTRNPGKLREFHELLDDMDSRALIRLLEPGQVGLFDDVPETGNTYLENARTKALTYSKASGLVTLADDSGLEVDVLAGRPGIYSARFGPQPNATDADRRTYLLEQLAGQPRPWTARFRCVAVVAKDGIELFSSEGVCEGEVIPEERGDFGFGYDPIFLVHGQERTMAELPLALKNNISHRALAVAPVKTFLLDDLWSREN